jgi:outer membrane protein assembly factor BamB
MSGIKSGLVWGGIIFLMGFGLVWGGDKDIVSPELLDQAGFRRDWQIQLPLEPLEQVERLNVFGNYLYVLTDQNFFFCIDRNTGAIRTLLQIATAGLPVLPPLYFEKNSAFLVGQELKIFNPVTGQITRTMKLAQMDGSRGGIAQNSKFVYICGSDNRLYAFTADEGVSVFTVTADNDSAIHSVLATDEMVWFGTAAGNIVAIDPTSPRKIWQFNLSGKMEIPPVLDVDGGFIYAGGLDTKLYKINAAKGLPAPAWETPFFAGGPIRDPLILGKTCVYVYTINTGLHAVDKQTKKEIWDLLRDCAVLSEKDSRSYVYVQPGILSVMDNVTGKEVLSVNIAGVDRFAVNMTDSKVYLADKNGRVLAATPVAEGKSNPPKP